MLTPEQARQLNQDSHTTVLEYEYDTPERILPMGEVLELLQQTLDLAQQLRDESDVSPDAVRKTLIGQYPNLQLFASTHPTIFTKATDPSTPESTLAMLRQMITIRAQQECGELTETGAAHALEQTLANR